MDRDTKQRLLDRASALNTQAIGLLLADSITGDQFDELTAQIAAARQTIELEPAE